MALAVSKQTKSVKMGFKYPISSDDKEAPLADGLRMLFEKRILCDAEIVSSSQEKFPCHKAVLAAKSPRFAEVFAKDEPSATRAEVRLYDASPEACRLLLGYMYGLDDGTYDPKRTAVNLEVLNLADTFGLGHLRETCAAYMARELSTDNVIDTICAAHKHDLTKLRERIMGQLTGNKKALQDLAAAPQILQYPELMRELLALLAGDSQAPPNKKARNA